MPKSIKLKNDIYLDSKSIITNIKDNEIYETGEFLNSKRVYAKRIVTDETINYDKQYMIKVPHNLDLNLIDIIWIDMSNSFLINRLSNYLRCLPLVQTYYTDANSNSYFSATIDWDMIILMTIGGWATDWKKVITIKFTYK